jgi:hypothetical protein
MSITKFSALFESKDEGVIHTVSPPEVDISSVHVHVQNYKPKKPVKREHCFHISSLSRCTHDITSMDDQTQSYNERNTTAEKEAGGKRYKMTFFIYFWS